LINSGAMLKKARLEQRNIFKLLILKMIQWWRQKNNLWKCQWHAYWKIKDVKWIVESKM